MGQSGVRRSPGCHREARGRRALGGVTRPNVYGQWPQPSDSLARSRATLQVWRQRQMSMVSIVRTRFIGRRGRNDIDLRRKRLQ